MAKEGDTVVVGEFMDMDWIRTAKDCEIDKEEGMASDDDIDGERLL